jgi:hypothetical protein
MFRKEDRRSRFNPVVPLFVLTIILGLLWTIYSSLAEEKLEDAIRYALFDLALAYGLFITLVVYIIDNNLG